MRHYLKEIRFGTSSPVGFVDLTGRVRDALEESGVRDGLLTVFTRHTTAAVRINERCDRLQRDMLSLLEAAVPQGRYRHDEHTVDGRRNARGHLMSLLLGSSETIPIAGGKLALGAWQSVFFVELDGPRRQREVVVRIVGD